MDGSLPVGVCEEAKLYPAAPPTIPPTAVAKTVPQLPRSLNSWTELDSMAAVHAANPSTVAEPINPAAAIVAPVDTAATPLPTMPTANAAAAKPPQVATVATANPTTMAAPIAQCHHASTVGSTLLTGLFPQYANKFAPEKSLPVDSWLSKLINLPQLGL